jgi:hypothetical protein
MIDGEGVITIQRTKGRGTKGQGREWGMRGLVMVTNSHAGLIGFLRDVTGLGITYRAKSAGKPEWSLVHRWQVVGDQARRLLEPLIPYLVLKRELAEIVVSFPRQSKGGKLAIDDVIYEEQLRRWAQTRVLNRRGQGTKPQSFEAFPLDHPARGH